MSGVDAFIRRYRELPASYYREFAPSPDVSDFVACGWIKSVRGAPSRIPVIPDGCADVMTCDDGAPFVVGPDAETRWVALADGAVITGLRLRPGAAQAILGCDARELLGKSAALIDLGRDARGLHQGLQRLATPAERLSRLEQWVRTRLAQSHAPDRGTLRACRALARDPKLTLDEVSARLGWNARMLHRRFVAASGYGPKYLQRILRVQGVLRAARAGVGMPRLSEIAAELGFVDQAHLTRDFRSITGFTPRAYLAQADAEVGRWLDERFV